MTDSKTLTMYVATNHEGDWRVGTNRSAFEATEGERSSWQRDNAFQARSGFAAVWQVDLIDGSGARYTSAIAAVLNTAANVWTASTVTQLYPRPANAEERCDAARSVLRQDYWNDVQGVVEDIKHMIAQRELTDSGNVTEALDQACDRHQRVIYTGQAIECLLFTKNDDAWEEYGSLSDITSGEDSALAAYTKLAYFAFRADVADELGDIDALLEAAKPDECEDCGAELIDGEDNDIGNVCASCAEEAKKPDSE